MSSAFSYLNFIKFSNISRWDVKRFNLESEFADESWVCLKKILEPYKKTLLKQELIDNKIQIIAKINFAGNLFLRPLTDIKDFKSTLFEIPAECLIYSKINVKHGCTYFNKTGKTIAGTSEYPVFKIKKDLVDGEYLQKILRTNYIKKYLSSKTTGFSKTRVQIEEFLNTKIPLPSIEKQKEIVEKYNAKVKLAEEQEQKAETLEDEIENFLFNKLNIQIAQKQKRLDNKNLINFINYKSLSRWGVDFLKNESESKKLLKSSSFKMVKLGNIVDIDPKNNFSALDKNLKMSFIPMHCVSDEYGEIITVESGINSNSKGYTRFQEGDLIWAKITPCMQNGKSAILKNLQNGYGYGSTEFYVIRNNNLNVYLDYIYHILRTKFVRQNAMTHFTGSSGQQRVPKSYLQNLEIPLPDINIQKNISEQIYNMKHGIKQLKQSAEQSRISAQEEFEKELFE